jgi:hypothetical protein
MATGLFLRLSGTCCGTRRSELEGTDDEDYPESYGIDPDQPDQTQDSHTR